MSSSSPENEQEYPKWIYQKELVECVGYVEKKYVKRGKSIKSSVKIHPDGLPFGKGQMIAVVSWPLSICYPPEKWKIFALGIVKKGLKKTTEIEITHSFDKEYVVGDIEKLGNAFLAFIGSEIESYIKN